jgi:predicted nucleic acid-binding protein
MARKPVDGEHGELEHILKQLLDENTDVTARAVARRHSLFSSASTITRHPERRCRLEAAQSRQEEMRRWAGRLEKTARRDTAARLAAQDARAAHLEATVKALTDGHMALIAAVAQVGGIGTLATFYESFREVRDRLVETGALPTNLVAKRNP